MIAKNVTVASAAVTLKLPVAVDAAVQHAREERLLRRCSTVWLSSDEHVEDRDQADQRWPPRMNTKSVSSSGVQVFTHFLPTFGSTIVVADELDDDLERVHEAGRHQPVLPQIAPHRRR